MTRSAEVRRLVLIPAWNESGRIGPIVSQALEVLPVLVVDDGSKDATISEARAAGAQVIAHERNLGKGVALMTGFDWASEHGYEAVITLDADGQHEPAEIPKFVAVHRASDADLIIGRRDFAHMPFPRRYTNPFGSWLLSIVLAQRIYDNQSGYRLYGRRLLDLIEPTGTGFEWEVEVIAQAVFHGMRILWVDINTIYSTGKVSHFHPLLDSARFLRTVWQSRRWRRPPQLANDLRPGG